eukprot:TRINITY_DN2277_c0_g1_i1.p1 TRINITY_DN2277_c0_g1~~TRINITY_DN2277_c0_g1_i1.p1  ORF type:complete len:359 (-),score=73.20 TRINITY_DN2277_c0_g1_i1:42-1118(-)
MKMVVSCMFDNEGESLCSGIGDREVQVHVYQLNDEEVAEETDGEDSAAFQHWLLPNRALLGLWESLIYDSTIKRDLLDYVCTAMLFSDKGVNSKLITWNRVVLLHGPPGTGKTSLCKALAQKLIIRLSQRYAYGQLVEINSHSLFSKWFSESGKLVMKMFQKIHELLDDPDSFVVLLIDEVESLAAARKAALAGTEPSDSIRVVNAVLTQIDQLKDRDNVIIMTTSNITGAIDLAFVDRADIKQYIGLPTPVAIYEILSSCMNELERAGIMLPTSETLAPHTAVLAQQQAGQMTWSTATLFGIAAKCHGLSGRALRKLPFLAHSFYVQSETVTRERFFEALSLAADREITARATILAS